MDLKEGVRKVNREKCTVRPQKVRQIHGSIEMPQSTISWYNGERKETERNQRKSQGCAKDDADERDRKRKVS